MFDIESFLDMNNGKKFDVILMNPPYGSDKTGDRYLHFKFVDKILEICDKSIIIMPFRALSTPPATASPSM